MKTSRTIACLLLVLLLALSAAPAAFAEVVFNGEDQTLTGTYDATVFHAGSDPTSTADVKGIFLMAGNTVSAGGSSEYAFIAGNTVSIDGDCLRDAFIGGNTLGLTGTVGRDLYAAGKLLNLHGTVGRDVFAAAQSINIGGEIGGNVYLQAEQIQIADDAKIAGTLRINSDAKVTGPDEILARAERYENQKEQKEQKEDGVPVQAPAAGKSPTVFSKVKSKVFSCVGLLLIAYFLLWLTPLWEKVDGDYTGKSFGFYAGAFGIGFAVLAALPLAAILLMITGVGVRPAFVLLLIYIAVLIASPVFLGFFLGSLLWRKALKKACNYWAELAIGLLVWCILSAVPGLGFATALVSGPLALGVLTRMLGKKRAPKPALQEQNP